MANNVSVMRENFSVKAPARQKGGNNLLFAVHWWPPY